MATQADHDRLGAWAVIHNPDPRIDRHGAKRVVPMQVLSLGFPRTGTESMCEALQTLGYANPYHFSSIFANPRDVDMWIEAFRAKYEHVGRFGREEWDQLLGHCGAVTDVPAICFWEELLAAYPDAKVVLVERDEAKWMESAATLIDGVTDPFVTWVLRYTDPAFLGRVNRCAFWWMKALFGTTNAALAKKHMRGSYRRHYAKVRATVPKDKLLEYKLGSGWEPLCEILGKEVPDVPFPHRNEAKTLELALEDVSAKALRNSLRNVGMVVGAVVVAALSSWWAWKRAM